MSALPDIPPPFTVRTLAAYWGCSEGVIRKHIADGRLRSFRIGALIRIPYEEVERFKACQITPSNDSERDGQSYGETRTGSVTVSSLPRLTGRERKPRLASVGGSPKAPQAPWERS